MTWTDRRHGKGDIDRAGAALLPWWQFEVDDPEDLGWAYGVIQNWRSCHAMPLLTFRMALRNRANRVEPKAIVAQRLKRFSSVMNKLVREPNMKLSQMQDLGGCRAIMSTVEAVQTLYGLYADDLAEDHTWKCYDYIRRPKPDGYRGIHIVGRYKAGAKKNEAWNGQRIEIQLRSKLQHAFATAVETVTTFTKEPLKFGAGPEGWRRFFSLAGSLFAAREGTPLVEGTPSNKDELIEELRGLAKSLRVRQRLRGWTRAIRQLPRQNTADDKWLLLVLDIPANELRVSGYANRERASEALANIEKEARAKAGELDAVLVWIGSIKNLRRAYPNYYADTRDFIRALNIELLRTRS